MLTSPPDLITLLNQQRTFWASGAPRDLGFRLAALKRLRQAIVDRQAEIVAAVQQDLGRPEFEGYFEVGTISELDYVLQHLPAWVRPQPVPLALNQRPGKAWIQPQPKGVVLIIGPWNYPFQLILSPLIGAIAAGNCALVKPSELAPATAAVLTQLVAATFDPGHVAVVEGGVETAQALLAEKFDHIFFTGGERVGRLVLQAAAPHLTPVTLELGGKSPCLVTPDIDVVVAARRIIWGKFLNAGQTCVAPDYLLVEESLQPALTRALQDRLSHCYGANPAQSPDYGRIVNDRQFDRLVGLLGSGRLLQGGEYDRQSRYLAPTLIDQVSWSDPVMQEEIFGPILPILPYRHLDEAIALINQHPQPLALYLFCRDREVQQRVIASTQAGTVCLNDVILQVAVWDLPFGGRGPSGMGTYHGRHSFQTFSHAQGVLRKPFWLDMDWRYPPYGNKVKLFKRFLRLE
jgi:aldehyde dehydrogenase (NAD+)